MKKLITPEAAVNLVKDNDTFVFSGFLSNVSPEFLIKALAKRYRDTASPKNCTLVFASGNGTRHDNGLDHLALDGLLKRAVGGHWNINPALGKMAVEEKFEAYNLPYGVMCHMYRDIAAGKVGTITHVGLKTYIDPRQDGGKMNKRAQEDLVELITINGKEQLLYKSFPIDICFLRGTTADEKGNITMEKEGLFLSNLAIAQAVKKSGGTVVVQVENVVKAGTMHPKDVSIPFILVDWVVQAPPEEHMPEANRALLPGYSGDARLLASELPPLPLDERKITTRRAAMELIPNAVVNLGIGVPEAVALVANEEGIGDTMTLTVESGTIGGIPAGGPLFGCALNPYCIYPEGSQFDFYDGGGLDIAVLGLAECDEKGNINVSKLGSRFTGCGGFINITQNAKKLYFCGTFTAKGLRIKTGDGRLTILQEGSVKKFLKKVDQITFSGEYAVEISQPVLYITERAVFSLRKDGLHLVEIAPGVDLEKDVLAHMEFMPKMDVPPKLMDKRLFMEPLMGLLENY